MDKQWYDDRDKRTDSCSKVSGSYKEKAVQIIISDVVSSTRVQLLAYLSITMLARWCRHIILTLPDTPCLIKGAPSDQQLTAFLIEQVRIVDPYCQVNTAHESERSGHVRLFVGPSPAGELGEYVSINAAGWISCCALGMSSEITDAGSKLDILGAGFAASLGNSVLFRYLNGQREQPFCKWYSLLSNEVFEEMPQQPQDNEFAILGLGRVHLVGCGAIGSSFVFLLPFLPITGQWLLVDPDSVETHNISSSLLFNYSDVVDNSKKTQRSQDYLASYGISASTFSKDYKQLAYRYDNSALECPDLVLCFANENNIWATIQHQYPPVCFHATTSKSWGVHVGRHIPLKENCLMCTFQDVVATTFVPVCGEVPLLQGVKIIAESHTAILPFLAPAAAIITLSEIVKLQLGIHDQQNTTIFNMSTSDGSFLSDFAPFGSCFICSGQAAIYPSVGAFSRFWPLSR